MLMSFIDDTTQLRRLAFLYLTMAHRSDDYLSDSELESVTRMLTARSGLENRDAVQTVLMDALDDYVGSSEKGAEARVIAEALNESFSSEQKQSIYDDLKEIAEADGVLLKNERGMLRALAKTWDVRADIRAPQSRDGSWGVVHDLAYIFLVLAHSTDNDLSDTEMQVMYNKLREWEPAVSPDEVERVLQEAMMRYAEGQDDARLEAAIESVRNVLPREQRMAALNDLVKIANADGVFLDDEEDLINHLLSAWDVDPYANYGRHGSKE